MNQTNKTFNQAKIYGLGTIIRHMTAIIMLPIYTRYLTPADYGMAELLSMGVEIIGLIVGVVGGETLIRFYYDKNDEFFKKQVVFTASFISILTNSLAFFIIIFSASYYSGYIFKGTGIENGELLVILYGASLVFQVMSGMPGAYIKAQQKPGLYVFFSTLRLMLAVSANLYFVVYKELHIVGVVYSVFTFTLIDGLIQTTYMLSKTGVKFSFPLAKKMLHFSYPLLISSIALFLATYSDRLIIKEYSTLTALGLYALAYKFAFMLTSIAWWPIQQAWEVKRYEVVKLDNATEIFQTTFRQTQLYVIFVALAFTIMSKDVLRVMSDEAYHSAYKFVAILVAAYVFKIWSNFCYFGVLYTKKTKIKAYIEWGSGALSVGLFFALIPSFGAMGAAIATLIAFFVRFLAISYFSSKCYNMHLQWGFITKIALLAIILSAVSFSFSFSIIPSIIFNAGILLTYLLAILTLPFVHQQDKNIILKLLCYPLKYLKLIKTKTSQ